MYYILYQPSKRQTNSNHLLPCWYIVLHYKSFTMIKQLTFKVHLILARSYSCKFASFLKCIFGLNQHSALLLQSFADMSTVTRKSEPPNNSTEFEQWHSVVGFAHVLLMIYLVPLFLYLGACYHFSLKTAPNVELKCYLMLLGSRRLWCASQRNTC